jgi:hypothetical protein
MEAHRAPSAENLHARNARANCSSFATHISHNEKLCARPRTVDLLVVTICIVILIVASVTICLVIIGANQGLIH